MCHGLVNRAVSNMIMGVSCPKSIRLVGSGWFKNSQKMFHPSVRVLLITRQCTPVVALDRNALHTPEVGQLTNKPEHSFCVFLFAASCASAPFDSIQCLLSIL